VGEAMTVRIHYDCRRHVASPIFTVGFTSMENITVVANYSNYDASEGLKPLTGKGWVDFSIAQLAIKPGNYDCTVTMEETTMENVLDWHERTKRFTVVANANTMYGLFQPDACWTMGKEHAFGS
jgi:hypothetical protein